MARNEGQNDNFQSEVFKCEAIETARHSCEIDITPLAESNRVHANYLKSQRKAAREGRKAKAAMHLRPGRPGRRQRLGRPLRVPAARLL